MWLSVENVCPPLVYAIQKSIAEGIYWTMPLHQGPFEPVVVSAKPGPRPDTSEISEPGLADLAHADLYLNLCLNRHLHVVTFN